MNSTNFGPSTEKKAIDSIFSFFLFSFIFLVTRYFITAMFFSVDSPLSSETTRYLFIAVPILSAALTLARLIEYNFIRYELHEGEMVIREGVIWRIARTIPYGNLIDIELRQGPIDRLFGFADLILRTAGSYTLSNGDSASVEVVMSGVKDPASIQKEILDRSKRK